MSKSTKSMIVAAALALGLPFAAQAATKSESLHVKGWHCAGCAARTESALRDLKGVTAVKTNKDTKVVDVTYDDARVSHDQIAKAVESAGFTVEK